MVCLNREGYQYKQLKKTKFIKKIREYGSSTHQACAVGHFALKAAATVLRVWYQMIHSIRLLSPEIQNLNCCFDFGLFQGAHTLSEAT